MSTKDIARLMELVREGRSPAAIAARLGKPVHVILDYLEKVSLA